MIFIGYNFLLLPKISSLLTDENFHGWLKFVKTNQEKKYQYHKNISFSHNLIGKNSENLTLCSPKHFDMWHARK